MLLLLMADSKNGRNQVNLTFHLAAAAAAANLKINTLT